MYIQDSAIGFLENLLKGSSILKGEEMYLGGKPVHIDHDGYIAIRFVKGAGEPLARE